MTLSRTSVPIGEILLRHVEAFAEGDFDATMTDYWEDAVFLAPDGALRGSGEIRAFFKVFLAHFPSGSVLEVSWQIPERTSAYAVWSERAARSDIPFAAETLVVREGRVPAQTFAARLELLLDKARDGHNRRGGKP
jgi:hypothetical protein